MLDNLRLRLASVDVSPLLALLGICCGVLAGAVIIAFRWVIETSQSSFLPGGLTENYEALSVFARVMIAIFGALIIGLLFQWVSKKDREVGVVHVMERLAYHQGHMSLKNTALQFVGAAISIISGHSVGREGPGIHLGAASGSLLGQWLTLPNNSIRVLIACGIAAAIAASFNTPIAGVIFAMEVVMMEYTIAGFAPVILASVSGTVVTRWVYGAEPAFVIPNIQVGTISELPFVIVVGVTMGILSFLFIFMLQNFTHLGQKLAIWQRMTLAGVVTALCAVLAPQIMGIGYDTVNSALLGEIGLLGLVSILLMKLMATSFGLGFGLPGGLIGPSLFIGAVAGGIIGLLVETGYPDQIASIGFYAMIGMGAMMAATLQAPLAAIMALLELTANPNIILPGMLAVIIATMTTFHVFRKESVFITLLKARGLDYQNDPLTQSLRRVGVASVMDNSFGFIPQNVPLKELRHYLKSEPQWLFIRDDAESDPLSLLLAADLDRYIKSIDIDDAETNVEANVNEDRLVDLLEIPAQRHDISSVNMQATLQEAMDELEVSSANALYVVRNQKKGKKQIVGVITSDAMSAYYRP